MAVLKATHLAKSYKSRQVVRDVSIEVSTGQIVGLLGPNGAGKTTTFYMIVGLVPLDKGDIYIDQQKPYFATHACPCQAGALDIYLKKPRYSES